MRIFFLFLFSIGSCLTWANVIDIQAPSSVIHLGQSTASVQSLGVTQVWSNRPEYVRVTLSGDTLTITALKSGFASITYKDQWGGQTSVGLAVEDESGKMPGIPNYFAIGGRSIMSYWADAAWWGEGGNGVENTRWTDIIDIYMQGGPDDWVYQNKGDIGWKPGSYLSNFIINCKRAGRIPCIVMYCIPPSGKGDTALLDLQSVSDHAYMVKYYNRAVRTLRQIIWENTKDDQWPALVVLEPDFLGYMMQTIRADPNSSKVEALGGPYTPQVEAAFKPGPAESGFRTEPLLNSGLADQFPNTLKGLVTSISYILKEPFIADDGTPNAQWGSNIQTAWKVNLWASPADGGFSKKTNLPNGQEFGVGKGICRWTDVADGDQGLFDQVRGWLAQEAKDIAKRYFEFGITESSDFVAIDRYGIDGGSQNGAADPAKSVWFWNADHWNNYLLFIASVHSKFAAKSGRKLPILAWQIPCGHINTSQALIPGLLTPYPPLPNTPGGWEDSAQTYIFGDSFANVPSRLSYFSQNYSKDPKILAPQGNIITWESHLKEFAEAGVFAIVSAPGVGPDSSTYVVKQGNIGPYDHLWWINHVQNYLENPLIAPLKLATLR